MNIAIIPARSGSKGFANKNIAKINGVTLIEYAIRCALQSTLTDKVIISTDSSEYEKIAKNAGATSLGLRKAELSGDKVKSVDVVVDLLKNEELMDADRVVLLQPTSPVRTGAMIDACIALSLNTNEAVTTVARIEEPHPYKLKKIENGAIRPFIDGANSEVDRQSLPEVYALAGSVYVAPVNNILENHSFFSENTQPYYCDIFVNVDTEDDLEYLEYLVGKNRVCLP